MFLNNDLKRFCGLLSATAGILVVSVTPGFALVCAAPAPLIGVTGPYGIAAMAIGYGGFLVYRKLKNRS